MERMDCAEVFPSLEMGLGKDRDDLHVRLRFQEAFDGALQDGTTVQQEELLGGVAAHSGTASAGHENPENISAHKSNFTAAKLRKFIYICLSN